MVNGEVASMKIIMFVLLVVFCVAALGDGVDLIQKPKSWEIHSKGKVVGQIVEVFPKPDAESLWIAAAQPTEYRVECDKPMECLNAIVRDSLFQCVLTPPPISQSYINMNGGKW